MADLALDLSAVGRNDLPTTGGKGANLGELLRAGFPVPPGFVVTTAAYDEFINQNELRPVIEAALREGSAPGQRIRSAFREARVPVAVSQTIRARYQKLGLPPVAVRSSATAEDLPDAAFAGQQDTFLNIIGIDDLLNAVRDCWASLWTDRAVAYRARLEMDQAVLKLAVVVQQMVQPEVAGVLFTANPITGARNEMVVDANPGLGEAVVSGATTPDHLVLRHSRLGWRVVERQLGRRESIVRGRAGGGTETVSLAEHGGNAALHDRALRRLARLAHQIELHFDAPQDIEWGWADDQMLILQTRPITALPEPRIKPNLMQKQLLHQLGERFQIRPYPLDLTTWGEAIWGAAVDPFLAMLGIRMRHLDEMFIVEDGVAVGLAHQLAPRLTPWVLLAPLRLALQAQRFDPRTWEADPILVAGLAEARELRLRDTRHASWPELLASLHQALELPMQLAGESRRRYLPRAALAAGGLWLLLAALGKGHLFGRLLGGVPTRTLDANAGLEALAAEIRGETTLAQIFAAHEPPRLREALAEDPRGQSFLGNLEAFLQEYGHREQYIVGASQPTWGDAPEVVLGILKGLARSEPRPQPAAEIWAAARDQVLAHPLLSMSRVQAFFIEVLDTARWLLLIREDSHFYTTLPLPIIRRISLEFGQRLTDVGALDGPGDVFQLTRSEIERCGGTWPPPPGLINELRSSAERRKERRAALEATPFIDLSALVEAAPRADALLHGAPGSPGVASGPARVIHGEAEFSQLEAGEVLVAPFTNPAWTPLFQRAAAVVVDVGGPASHAAIVAREYGIPAIMGTIEGTSRLRDGQPIRVDGTHGLVFAEP